MEKEISGLESWHDIVLENALDAVVGINTSSVIFDWNKNAESIFGFTKSEVLGQSITLIIPAKYRDAHYRGMAKYLQTGIGPILNQRIELEALHKDGHTFPIELTVIPIKGKDKNLFYSFIRDITEQKRLHEELSNAVKARDEFISICSHELKSPITAMSLTFQLAEKHIRENNDAFKPDEVIRRVQLANRHVEKMSRLVDDMLDVSRIASGNMSFDKSDFNFSDLLNEVLQKFEDELKTKTIEIKTEYKDEHYQVNGDRFRLEQVLSNLISNAIKYGEGNPIHFTLWSREHQIVLAVKDFGIGISKENLNRIFDRFERAVSSSDISGLGLGLFICQEIVKAHNGRLYVHSELGKGSTFFLELPSK